MDLNAVMAFVISHAGRYMADPEKVFLVGDSAGAQMASQYLAAVTNPAYAAFLGLAIPKFAVRACALNCGFYIPDPHKDKMLLKCYLQDAAQVNAEAMNIAANITADYPPSFVMTSNGDFLRERAKPFVDLLTTKGVEAEYHEYSPQDQELGHVFHCNMKEPYAKICNDEECAFFAAHVMR
jgi:acetyl esterase/lipase